MLLKSFLGGPFEQLVYRNVVLLPITQELLIIFSTCFCEIMLKFWRNLAPVFLLVSTAFSGNFLEFALALFCKNSDFIRQDTTASDLQRNSTVVTLKIAQRRLSEGLCYGLAMSVSWKKILVKSCDLPKCTSQYTDEVIGVERRCVTEADLKGFFLHYGTNKWC